MLVAMNSYRRIARVEHASASNGDHRGILPEDEAVAGEQQNRTVKLQARESGLAGQKLLGFEQGHLRDGLGGEGVQMDARILPQRLGRRQQVKLHAQPGPRDGTFPAASASCRGPVRWFPRRRRFSAVRCPAMASFRGRAVHLHSAHPQALARGMDFDLLLLADGPRDQRPGDHRSEAFHGEDAIDGQAKDRGGIFGRNLGGQPC